MPGLTVIDLEANDLDKAWPLVRTVSPWLGPLEWRAAAIRLAAHSGGVIAVVAPDGCLHGVATYETLDKPRVGRVLFVETLVSFELSRKAPVRQHLCDYLERLAPALGCDSIAISMPLGGSVPRSWRSADWLAGAGRGSEGPPGLLLS